MNAAIKMLSKSEFGIHTVNDDIINELQAKHPKPAEIKDDTLLYGSINKVLPSYFDEIDENMVLKACSRTKGVGGPSQLDAEQYRHILTSKKFKLRIKTSVYK